MNEKKSKQLRQLVRHLQKVGAIEETWLRYGKGHRIEEVEVPIDDQGNKKIIKMAVGTLMMDPACGRAIYQSMKKRAYRNQPVM